ncbi:DUF58 domain-containing protein [Actinomadura sp. LD22]|uniref:DUF58 domain-containing protein n=1 Tax=Actinomadura physcomitrii TaxID=2650748 RepID=A0A6I4MTB4_9ACTN|nr:DUF58 domain-containing protein [Actinomadura physcomitrii]MVZ98954.1 DUF58 domain-containing protein [Actinomadura physcomitrii]MWA05536.1 DUF58 domain-containing protein [Actinomadura physcomitrii]
MALTGRLGLLALLGALVPILLPSWWTLLALWGVLLLGVVVDLALAGNVRALRFHRSGDTNVRLGETAHVALIVENLGRRRLKARLRDVWPPSAAAAPRTVRVDVPAGERRRVDMALTPTRRGDRRAVTVVVRSVGPLGLAARQLSRSAPWTVRALPAFPSRRHLPAKLARLRELTGAHVALIRGQGTEFDSLREYVDGDDVRSIDWRATARRADVVVRTWRPERDRRIYLVLDTGRTSAGRVGDIPRLDCSMDAALLLGALASRAGDRVDMLAYDRRVRARVEGASRTDLLPSMVHAMAPLEPELLEFDAAGMVSTLMARVRQRCLVVLLTELNTAAIEEGLLPLLPRLTARHLVMIAAVSDPRVGEMAGGRGDLAAVYDAAAAERARAERGRLTAELRTHGVEVVDAPPQDIAPALADAYLALKAAGRL